MQSRRDALRVLAAGAIVPALGAAPTPPKNLSPDELQLLARVVDLIIPRTDTPGASDAGVPLFIDRAIGRRASLAPQIQAGLARLQEAGFFTAGPQQQTAQLTALEARSDPFFQSLKDLTIDGYYSSREGLVQELEYHGNTYVREFVGCTHPQHGPGTGDAN